MYFQGAVFKIAKGDTLKKLEQVTLYARHHHLCLRVTESGIIFNNIRLACNVHQPEENKSAIVNPIPSPSVLILSVK